MPSARLIGLISDTHGLVRPEVFEALAGVEVIFHAGDVGGRDVIHVLSTIAPVQAVFGNVDPPGDPGLCAHFAETFDGVTVHVSHGHELGSPAPSKLLDRYDADVIVFGHTHRPLVLQAGSRLVVNPGSAGPRRFDLLPSVARLSILGGHAEAEIIQLALGSRPSPRHARGKR
jgi:putative phosphoesterase